MQIKRLTNWFCTRWVVTWGNGDFGRLGHEGRWGEVYPRKVSALDGVDVKEVCAGGAHTAAVTGGVHRAQYN